MKSPTFSIDLHDQDGDVYESCILLHFDEVILKFESLDELEGFCIHLSKRIIPEIKELTHE